MTGMAEYIIKYYILKYYNQEHNIIIATTEIFTWSIRARSVQTSDRDVEHRGILLFIRIHIHLCIIM